MSEKQTENVNEPEVFKGDGIKTVKHSKLKDVFENKLKQLKDLATMELLLPVDVRMRKRLESIRKQSSAQHLKVDGHWKTIPPEFHITKLEGRKLNESEAEIRFSMFAVDEKGNKLLKEHKAESVREDGSKVTRVVSANYVIAFDVVERIQYRKPIVREMLDVMK